MLRLVRSWQDLGKILTSVPCGNACQDHGKILSRSWQANDMKISSSEKLKKTCLTQSNCHYIWKNYVAHIKYDGNILTRLEELILSQKTQFTIYSRYRYTLNQSQYELRMYLERS